MFTIDFYTSHNSCEEDKGNANSLSAARTICKEFVKQSGVKKSMIRGRDGFFEEWMECYGKIQRTSWSR